MERGPKRGSSHLHAVLPSADHPASLRVSGDGAGTSDAMPGGGLPFAGKTCWCGRYPMPTHWSTGRQLELVRSDPFSIAEGSEALGAARRAREEERLRSLLSKAPGTKSGDGSYGGKNRKGKSAGKGKPEEGGKGRGGDGRGRDDAKNAAKK